MHPLAWLLVVQDTEQETACSDLPAVEPSLCAPWMTQQQSWQSKPEGVWAAQPTQRTSLHWPGQVCTANYLHKDQRTPKDTQLEFKRPQYPHQSRPRFLVFKHLSLGSNPSPSIQPLVVSMTSRLQQQSLGRISRFCQQQQWHSGGKLGQGGVCGEMSLARLTGGSAASALCGNHLLQVLLSPLIRLYLLQEQ